MGLRLACDTGGTFTDLLVEFRPGVVRLFKVSTARSNPAKGVLCAIAVAAEALGMSVSDLLGCTERFVHGTTHAINAVITGDVARTAFLTTHGHPDILVLREGGRLNAFDYSRRFPQPYIPRSLTFEVPERMGADGSCIRKMDDYAVIAIIERLRDLRVEAVGVCLLWSIVNPLHELRVGELLKEYLPGIPYTLSHLINPIMREYRRASAACIDASLKPLMSAYLSTLRSLLRSEGFRGELFVLTSQGGMRKSTDLEVHPIHAINSGPSMAPLAGMKYAELDGETEDVIVADTGGTTFDVSVVRRREINRTQETWIGRAYEGHMTGLPSVDIRSLGAGGGSLAFVDSGGLLRVGPQSAGADPGPACYNLGNDRPTLTDACVVLGYIDPAFFLGGNIKLDFTKAVEAVNTHVASRLNLSGEEAANAIVEVATENMAQAIGEITINQGIDPQQAVLVAGGGAAGLNIAALSQRLSCRRVIIPELGAALSALGAIIADATAEFRETLFLSTHSFDQNALSSVIGRLRARAADFIADSQFLIGEVSYHYEVEARYRDQIWSIPVAIPTEWLERSIDRIGLTAAFHRAHERMFAVCDEQSDIEFLTWMLRITVGADHRGVPRLQGPTDEHSPKRRRRAYVKGVGWIDMAVVDWDGLSPGSTLDGPAIIETPFTTVVIPVHSYASRSISGSVIVTQSAARNSLSVAGQAELVNG